MEKNIRKVLFFSSFAIVAIVSYKIGQSTGFSRGYLYQTVYSASSRAHNKVIILKRLRSGETESAIDLLEMILDGDIVIHRENINSGNPPIPYSSIFPNISESEKKLMVKVAKYRKEHPSTSVDLGTKRTVKFVVEHYLKKENPNQKINQSE